MTDAQKKDIMHQLISIVAYDSMRPVKLITIVLGIFAGMGFSAHPDEQEIYFLVSIMPLFIWAGIFLVVSVSRFIRMFTRVQHTAFIYVESAVSIWLWVMIFSSCIMSGARGMILLYIIPVLIESWLLGRSIFDYEMSDVLNKGRRKTDIKASNE